MILSKTQSPGVIIYKRLLGYVWPYKKIFIFSLIGMAMVAGAEVAFAALLKPIMDGGFVERDRAIIQLTPFLLMGVFVARALGAVADEYCIAWVGRRVIYDLRQELFAKMIRLPSQYFDQNSSATLISRLIYDLEQVSDACTTAVRVTVKDSLLAIGLLVWMFILSWSLTLLFLLITPIVTIIVRRASSRFRRSSEKIQDSMAGITHATKEAAQGQRVIKAYNGFVEEELAFEAVNQSNRRQSMRKVAVAAVSVPLLLLIAGTGVSGIIYLALSDTIVAFVTPGTFVSYIGTILLLMSPIKRLARVNEYVQAGIAAATTVFQLLDEKPEQRVRAGSSQSVPIDGHIEFRDVVFRYSSGEDCALAGVSFEVRPGQTVALVGDSGSGKSTAASLLLGFYRGFEGQILIDGRPIDDYSLQALRAQISWVSQEPILFDGSIKQNVTYGQYDQSSGELEKILQEIEVDKLISDDDKSVGELGNRLSGGQRQRVAIARALLRKGSILVMDEATSALDLLSEERVREAIIRRAQHQSVLLIAHRLGFIAHADMIHVFSGGKIIESGSHQALLNLSGQYAAMWATQQNAERSETPIEYEQKT